MPVQVARWELPGIEYNLFWCTPPPRQQLLQLTLAEEKHYAGIRSPLTAIALLPNVFLSCLSDPSQRTTSDRVWKCTELLLADSVTCSCDPGILATRLNAWRTSGHSTRSSSLKERLALDSSLTCM